MAEREPKEIYFQKNGLFAHTSHVKNEDAFITVEIAVVNASEEDQPVWIDIHMHQLIDTGKLQIAEEPGIKAKGMTKLFLPKGTQKIARTQLCVENAVMWNTETPILYVVEAVLYKLVQEGEALPNPKLVAGLAMQKPHSMKMLDFEETRFGIREIAMDAKNGFCINGKSMKLIGTKIPTSTENQKTDTKEEAFELEYEKVKAYKESGCNAVWVESEKMSDDFFDACNRLGVLVFDEVCEKERICHERSFPSVAAWLMGKHLLAESENKERNSLEFSELVRALDSTRCVGGVCDASFGESADGSFDYKMWNDLTEAVCAPWDFVGYPKENDSFSESSILFPNRIIFVKGGKSEIQTESIFRYSNVIGIME